MLAVSGYNREDYGIFDRKVNLLCAVRMGYITGHKARESGSRKGSSR
jgi:hypothetical protein